MTDSLALPTADGAEATLALLWERVRRRGDMPGFSRAIRAILASMRGEDERAFSMTQTVLSDPVLTQKVLRLANSSMYAAFGQRISTVSKAVLVLGTDTIGHLALGLKLIEELSKSTPDSALAHAEMEKAVLAGMVAQQVAASAATRDPEEAVVCAILHSLGRMMVTFYLPERWAQLQALGGSGGEDACAEAVLGLSLEALGRATAEHWGLPRNLVAAMRALEPAERESDFAHEDWLAALATMSTRCARALWNDDAAGAAEAGRLAFAFAPLLGLAPGSVLAAVDRARHEAAADLTLAPLARSQEQPDGTTAPVCDLEEGNRLLAIGLAEMRDPGIDVGPGQLASMALETIHRGLGFTRAFAFLRNRRDGKYVAKMGLGEQAAPLVSRLVFEDRFQPDVFHAALASDRVIFIENALDPAFAAKLPAWWKGTLLGARSFVVIPLCIGGHPVGFLYGDWDDGTPPVRLSQGEFALLGELRGLVVRGFERRAQGEAVAARS